MNRILPLLALPCILACGGDAAPTDLNDDDGDAPLVAETVDCTASNGECPTLTVAGEVTATLPNGQPSPARGLADPSIRQDPNGTTLWMAYSSPHVDETVRVESHLARSDDGGASWSLVQELWQSVPVQDGQGVGGFLNSEVVSLAPRATALGTTWYSARLRYFTTAGGSAQVPSFTIQVAAASSPTALAAEPEATLAGDMTDAYWQPDVNLNALSNELDGCVWNDPGLLYHDDALYLAMQCSIFFGAEERVEQSFVAVFVTQPNGAPATWSWRYAGRLAGHAEAVELGGETLMQTDLAVGGDGQLLAIFSPSAPGSPLAMHYGCRVVEIASLEPPSLARYDDGELRVRASATASDLVPSGPGACAYDAASATGVVLTRRVLDGTQLVVSLVQTGLRP